MKKMKRMKRMLFGITLMVCITMIESPSFGQEQDKTLDPYVSLSSLGSHMDQDLKHDQALSLLCTIEREIINQTNESEMALLDEDTLTYKLLAEPNQMDKTITREDYYNTLVQILIKSHIKLSYDSTNTYTILQGNPYKTPYVSLAMMNGLVASNVPFVSSQTITYDAVEYSIEALKNMLRQVSDNGAEEREKAIEGALLLAKSSGSPNLIAHGGGTYMDVTTPNTSEAIEMAIKNGYAYIELDFLKTSDNQYILAHDWWQSYLLSEGPYRVKTRDEFLTEPSKVNQHKMDFEGLIQLLDTYPHVTIITDTKDDNVSFLAYIKVNYPTYLNRFIPQIYDGNEYDNAKFLGFEHIIFSLYKVYKTDREVINFASDHDLYGVTMAVTRANTVFVQSLIRTDTCVFVHTVNDIQTYETLMNQGVTGIYTDIIVE